MKKIYLITLFILLGTTGFAQYYPGTSQVFQFGSVVNPAYSGLETTGDLKVSYRYQWTGLGSESPTFANVLYSFRLSQPKETTTHALRTSKTQAEVPVGKRIFHGMSLNAFHETVSFIKGVGIYASYGVHVPVTENTFFAAGMGVVFEDRRVNTDRFYLGINPDVDSYYESFINQGTRYSEINLRTGLALHGKNYFLGVSYLPAIRKAIRSFDSEPVTQRYILSFQGGASIRLSPEVTLRPSVWATLLKAGGLEAEYSLKMFYQDKLWIGSAYRMNETGSVGIGYSVNQALTISYMYDFSMGGFRQFGTPSHEIVLGLRFNSFNGNLMSLW